MKLFVKVVVLLSSWLWLVEGYYIPGTYPKEFKKAEILQV